MADSTGLRDAAILAAARAGHAIPPAWPLASSVAVNPFLGQADESLAMVAARLARVGGVAVTMPRSWYRERILSGEIADADLADALVQAPAALRPANVAALKAAASAAAPDIAALPTIADLAAEVSGLDWPGIVAERFGAWAASYFDQGQALWTAPRGRSAYAAWRAVATHDLTPEILGLSGFANHVADMPEGASDTLAQIVGRLGLRQQALETYFHQLLLTLGGWAQYARYPSWGEEQGADAILTDLLAVRLVWEAALYAQYQPQIAARWQAVIARHADAVSPTADQIVDTILQEAWERASQREMARLLAQPSPAPTGARPALQMVFCIDVRSEVFRRALESISPAIQTLGFAGFFGAGVSHRRFASDVEELRLPVLLKPALHACSGGPEHRKADEDMRIKARATRAWGRFKRAAVSSFAFVEATGPIYAAKLLGDALGRHGTPPAEEPPPRLVPAPDVRTQIRMAETVLRAMSLTKGFAQLVVLAGHGANLVNNPHASSLQCGACGGYSGEVNARLVAALLNDPAVRAGLAQRDITIPPDTLFVGALHDTTTDTVTLYRNDHPGDPRDVMQAQAWLEQAGRLARAERAARLPRAKGGASLMGRGRDWAQVRPEWGLAGCRAFMAAPRRRTAGRRWDGRVFLHDYDWRADPEFAVLELILTAPVVVASWISLQYYGSAVAPAVFGGGNKLLHNVTGGLGVVEGNGGVLRVGLPWQSVHDGERFAHDPLRLSVCVEAPRQAISDILGRHDGVRSLFNNRWLHLFALDDAGQIAWRYGGNLEWLAEGAGAARGGEA